MMDPGPDTTVNEPSGSVFPAVTCPAFLVLKMERQGRRVPCRPECWVLGSEMCQWRPVQVRVLSTTLVSLGP